MNTCPCCAHPMLRHIRHHQVYWFCRNCWQEMPLLESAYLNLLSTPLDRQLAYRSPPRSLVTV